MPSDQVDRLLPKAITAFRDELERRGSAAVRLTRGREIDAACAQLAARSRPTGPPGSTGGGPLDVAPA